jgi:hypothetical protein
LSGVGAVLVVVAKLTNSELIDLDPSSASELANPRSGDLQMRHLIVFLDIVHNGGAILSFFPVNLLLFRTIEVQEK